MILFADDIVLFTTDPNSLQSQIDAVHHYSVKWGLKINISKTKICVFEKKKQNVYPDFYIDNETIETVDKFVYLGIKFTYTGNMQNAVRALNEQALRAYNNLLNVFDKVSFIISTKLSLFDSMIVPILTYGCEVWGVYNYKEVDKLHIRFCKYLLGVKKQTPTYAVYGELGRVPLSVICKERAVKFWLKIMKNNELPIYHIYNDLCDNVNTPCWASRINSIVDHLGYAHIRLFLDHNVYYYSLLKSRIRDQFVQEWHDSINAMSKLDSYCKYKTEFCFEKYLDVITNDKLRKLLTSIRLCSHSLEIEVGRYYNIERDNRLCKLCNQNAVESEYHFILCCSKYRCIRSKYIGNCSWPTVQKFILLMSTKSKKCMYNLAKYIKESLCLRQNALENLTIL